MPAKAHGKGKKRAGQKKKSGSGGSAGKKCCPVLKMTTHNDAECYAQMQRKNRGGEEGEEPGLRPRV